MAAHQVPGIFASADKLGGVFFCFAPPPANLKCCDDGNSLSLAYSPEITKLVYGSLSKLVQVVIIMVQDAFAEFDGGFIVIARTYQDSDQFGVGQSAPALGVQLFARPVL